MFAELLKEDSGDGCYTLRYCVYNGDLIGSYGVHFSGDRAYGASRDYHRIATSDEIKAYADYRSDPDNADYTWHVDKCCYHDDKLSICDGSSLVEVITDNEQRCFEIAAMMADVDHG